MKPDFYMPYQGGHLPMRVVNVTAVQTSDPGLAEVRMTIEAVSVGPPIDDHQRPEWWTDEHEKAAPEGIAEQVRRWGPALVSCADCGQPLEDDNCPDHCTCAPR